MNNAPWSVHVILRNPVSNLGEAFARVIPHQASLLAAQGLTDTTIQMTDDEIVHARLSGPITDPQFADDLERSPQRDEIKAALANPTTDVIISPTLAGPGEHVSGIIVLAIMMAMDADVAAIWFPHQQHVTTGEQLLADKDANMMLTYRVHPSEAIDKHTGAITRGFAALGGREVFFQESDSTFGRVAKIVRNLDQAELDTASMPSEAVVVKYGFSKYELRPENHPVTGEPVLLMAPKKRKGLFSRG